MVVWRKPTKITLRCSRNNRLVYALSEFYCDTTPRYNSKLWSETYDPETIDIFAYSVLLFQRFLLSATISFFDLNPDAVFHERILSGGRKSLDGCSVSTVN